MARPRPRVAPCSVIALVGAVLVVAGCRPDAPPDDVPVALDVSIAPTPPIVGPVRMVLEVSDEAGSPVEEAEVRVQGTMTHAGMTPVLEEASHEGNGRYVVPAFEFTMGGDWILIVTIELPDGREAVRRREVTVVGERPPQGSAGGNGASG